MYVLVDYDNVPSALWSPGPVEAASTICAQLPAAVIGSEPDLVVRLYGGWKTNSISTQRAQGLTTQLTTGHTFIPRPGHSPDAKKVRLVVELALGPLGGNGVFATTLQTDRPLRSFRPKPNPAGCVNAQACGLRSIGELRHSTPCSEGDCAITAKDVLVRDEQKMVDTLMVADMAHIALIDKHDDLVVVSSDADIWPGVLLAIKAGCAVTQVHATPKIVTASNLKSMLHPGVTSYYREISI
ncbi:hypothetical protein U4I95_02500 [Stenotrophomonas maltophilia]|uniref:hypothetical protein n=1 Tax=Stenotrophomonas maltophilia TaxID=40324 RepID=UPI002ACC53B0|nr:hypothetical protein [Stenotrophomonas maltophilia]MDZ5789348.1 hypothetical protein [Stenotrophomonas maltophilia]